MNHAISNAGSLEADYYRRETLASIADLAKERREFLAKQIRDSFDWKDVRDALELAGKKDPAALEALCEEMRVLATIRIDKIEDKRLRNIAIAFSAISNYYAGHRAAEEVS